MAPASWRRGGHSPAGGRRRWRNPSSPRRESRPGSRRRRCATGGGGPRRNPSPRRHVQAAATTGRRKAPPRHPRTHADRSLASWRCSYCGGRPDPGPAPPPGGRPTGGEARRSARIWCMRSRCSGLSWVCELVERTQIFLLLLGAQLRQLVDQRVDARHVDGRLLVLGGELLAHFLDLAQPLAPGRRHTDRTPRAAPGAGHRRD